MFFVLHKYVALQHPSQLTWFFVETLFLLLKQYSEAILSAAIIFWGSYSTLTVSPYDFKILVSTSHYETKKYFHWLTFPYLSFLNMNIPFLKFKAYWNLFIKFYNLILQQISQSDTSIALKIQTRPTLLISVVFII